MSEENPAMVAARASWRCVQAKDKEGWLALMTDDVHIEDPIGVGPTNPTGEGLRGKEAVGAFFSVCICCTHSRITRSMLHPDRSSRTMVSMGMGERI